MNELSWPEGLENVRVAYRVIAAYQKRIMSMIELAAKEFEPLDFAVWFPVEHDMPPRRGTDLRTRWVWDFLPMNTFAVCLNTAGQRRWEVRKGELVVFLYFSADFAFVEAFRAGVGAGGPELAKMNPARDSETYFSIYSYCWEGEAREIDCWHDLWQIDEVDSDERAVSSGGGDFTLLSANVSMEKLEKQEQFLAFIRDFKRKVSSEQTSIWSD